MVTQNISSYFIEKKPTRYIKALISAKAVTAGRRKLPMVHHFILSLADRSVATLIVGYTHRFGNAVGAASALISNWPGPNCTPPTSGELEPCSNWRTWPVLSCWACYFNYAPSASTLGRVDARLAVAISGCSYCRHHKHWSRTRRSLPFWQSRKDNRKPLWWISRHCRARSANGGFNSFGLLYILAIFNSHG